METKPPIANALTAATSVPKYSKDDLQQILKTVLQDTALALVFAPTPTPVPTLIVAKARQEKLKAHFPNVYCGKSHMDYYNFCQQYEDYFAIAGTTGPTQILFATFFL